MMSHADVPQLTIAGKHRVATLRQVIVLKRIEFAPGDGEGHGTLQVLSLTKSCHWAAAPMSQPAIASLSRSIDLRNCKVRELHRVFTVGTSVDRRLRKPDTIICPVIAGRRIPHEIRHRPAGAAARGSAAYHRAGPLYRRHRCCRAWRRPSCCARRWRTRTIKRSTPRRRGACPACCSS